MGLTFINSKYLNLDEFFQEYSHPIRFGVKALNDFIEHTNREVIFAGFIHNIFKPQIDKDIVFCPELKQWMPAYDYNLLQETGAWISDLQYQPTTQGGYQIYCDSGRPDVQNQDIVTLNNRLTGDQYIITDVQDKQVLGKRLGRDASDDDVSIPLNQEFIKVSNLIGEYDSLISTAGPDHKDIPVKDYFYWKNTRDEDKELTYEELLVNIPEFGLADTQKVKIGDIVKDFSNNNPTRYYITGFINGFPVGRKVEFVEPTEFPTNIPYDNLEIINEVINL